MRNVRKLQKNGDFKKNSQLGGKRVISYRYHKESRVITMLDEKIKEYDKRFGGFPTMIFRGYEDDEIIKIIDDCLKQEKDVYEAGYLTLDDDIKY